MRVWRKYDIRDEIKARTFSAVMYCHVVFLHVRRRKILNDARKS